MDSVTRPLQSLISGGPLSFLQGSMSPVLMATAPPAAMLYPRGGGVAGLQNDAVPLSGNPMTMMLRGDPRAMAEQLLGPAGVRYMRTGVGDLPNLPESEQETNPAARFNRHVIPYTLNRGSGAAPSFTDIFPTPGRFELALAYNASRLSDSRAVAAGTRGGYDSTRIHQFLEALQRKDYRKGETPTIIHQRAMGYTPPVMEHAGRSMMRTIQQFNYASAYQEAQRFLEEGAKGAGDFNGAYCKEYVATKAFLESPAAVFHSLNYVDGSVFESEDTDGIFPVWSGATRERTKVMTIIKEGQTYILDYTKGKGVTEGATISLIVRRHRVDATTQFVYSSYGESPLDAQRTTLGMLGAGRFISPVQIAVLCWPRGLPPDEYRNYKFEVGTDGRGGRFSISMTDGLIVPVGRILHRAAPQPDRYDYTDPPTPAELEPLWDMSGIAHKQMIEVILKPSLRT